jgi:hypothetical protein
MSVIPLKADIRQRARHVRYVPIADTGDAADGFRCRSTVHAAPTPCRDSVSIKELTAESGEARMTALRPKIDAAVKRCATN